MLILAVDPGESTGIAIDTSHTYTTITLLNKEDVYDLFSTTFDVVILEQFEPHKRISTYGLHTIELVGSVQALALRAGAKLIRQSPARKNAWVHVAKRFTNGTVHEREALAHLLHWKYQNKLIDKEGNDL